jgi:hypothetical protein
MDLLNDPGVFPFRKIVINQFPFGKATGKHSPLAACFKHVEYGIENIPQRMFSLAIVV